MSNGNGSEVDINSLPDKLISISSVAKVTLNTDLPDSTRKATFWWLLNQKIKLPRGMIKFIAKGGNLKELIEIPTKLTGLSIPNHGLKSLPKLPTTLKRLNVDNNLLEELPELPDKLEKLSCCNNALTELPELPKSLEDVFCSGNYIEIIPKHFYNTIIDSVPQKSRNSKSSSTKIGKK
tara:strand:- start:64 stop:600 length:537 start_codon:yes stop_codon:yes gene_type:complete